MALCTRCGRQTEDAAEFCSGCGSYPGSRESQQPRTVSALTGNADYLRPFLPPENDHPELTPGNERETWNGPDHTSAGRLQDNRGQDSRGQQANLSQQTDRGQPWMLQPSSPSGQPPEFRPRSEHPSPLDADSYRSRGLFEPVQPGQYPQPGSGGYQSAPGYAPEDYRPGPAYTGDSPPRDLGQAVPPPRAAGPSFDALGDRGQSQPAQSQPGQSRPPGAARYDSSGYPAADVAGDQLPAAGYRLGPASAQPPAAGDVAPGQDPDTRYLLPGQDPATGYPAPSHDPTARYALHIRPASYAPPGQDPGDRYAPPAQTPAAGYAPPGQDPATGYLVAGQEPGSRYAPSAQAPAAGYAPSGQDPATGYAAPGQDPVGRYMPSAQDPAAGYAPSGQDPANGYALPGQDPAAGYAPAGQDPATAYPSAGHDGIQLPANSYAAPANAPPAAGGAQPNATGNVPSGPNGTQHPANAYAAPGLIGAQAPASTGTEHPTGFLTGPGLGGTASPADPGQAGSAPEPAGAFAPPGPAWLTRRPSPDAAAPSSTGRSRPADRASARRRSPESGDVPFPAEDQPKDLGQRGAARSGRWIPVAAAAVVLIICAVGAVILLSHGTKPASKPGAAAGRTPSPPPAAPSTTPPAASGLVAVAPAAASATGSPAVAAFLTRYFTAINDHDFAAYRKLFSTSLRGGLSESAFLQGYGSSVDSKATLQSITTADTGDLAAAVTFTSHQQPTASPNHTACNVWTISLYLERQGRDYVIVSPPASYQASVQACS